jgi:hypothetical protein
MLYAFYWSADPATFLVSITLNEVGKQWCIVTTFLHEREIYEESLWPSPHTALHEPCLSWVTLPLSANWKLCYIGGLVSNRGLPYSLCQRGRYNVIDAVLTWNTFPEATTLFNTFWDLLPSGNLVGGVSMFWTNLLLCLQDDIFVNCNWVDTWWQ